MQRKAAPAEAAHALEYPNKATTPVVSRRGPAMGQNTFCAPTRDHAKSTRLRIQPTVRWPMHRRCEPAAAPKTTLKLWLAKPLCTPKK
eukprot:6174181-Pleurochrysis_carterae.AAC.4